MVTPRQKLAESLSVLAERQGDDRRIFRTEEFHRVHRERLVRNGFLVPIIDGWLMLGNPGVAQQDSTPWYASFWEFCARYCTRRFGEHWHLSPELSLLLHAENSAVPQQVIVHAKGATNNRITLPFDTSFFDLKTPRLAGPDQLCVREGLRLHTPESGLLHAPKRFFQHHPVEAQTVLARIPQVGGLLRRLVDGSHSTKAGRLAGAFRHIGRKRFADEISRAMRETEHVVRESNPFVSDSGLGAIPAGRVGRHSTTPIGHRLRALWESSREPILAAFPEPPGLPSDAQAESDYLAQVREAYRDDAYHSLSIEGYQVTPELIERVRSRTWNPDEVSADSQQRDALAARGYWQASQAVQEAVTDILSGADPGERFRTDHAQWYFELFQPCVAAGLYEASALAGYRNQAVFLRGSRHVPPRCEILADAMETLFLLLEEEPEPTVRAVAAHWLFGYIHPYPDGNGRIARFLMNAMLASGGYPWTVIRVEDRREYMAALEAASVQQDSTPFADMVAKRVHAVMAVAPDVAQSDLAPAKAEPAESVKSPQP